MSKKASNKNKMQDNLPGYPQYPDNEDIFKKDKEEDLDPDFNANAKETGKNNKNRNKEKNNPGDDLDVPGSELDDDDEETGNEDEENNYYSLGGEYHDDLEEDKGD